MTQKIERVRHQLWEMIRRHQAEGGQVRNMRIGNNSSDRNWGLYHTSILCLLGVVCKYHPSSGEGPTRTAANAFNISSNEAFDLEDGFEGWSTHNNYPFFQLGREIALKLEEEAGLT